MDMRNDKLTKEELISRIESIAYLLDGDEDEIVDLCSRRLYKIIEDIKEKDILE